MTGWPPSRRSRCSSVLSSGFPIVASPNRCQSREQSLQPRWQSKQWLLTFWPVCREGPPTESWKRAPRIAAVEFAASSCFLMSWHPPPEPVDKIRRKSHCNKNAIKSKTESTRQSKTRLKAKCRHPFDKNDSQSRSMSFNALFSSSSPLGSMSWSPSLYPEKLSSYKIIKQASCLKMHEMMMTLSLNVLARKSSSGNSLAMVSLKICSLEETSSSVNGTPGSWNRQSWWRRWWCLMKTSFNASLPSSVNPKCYAQHPAL